jgi:hypothetical protein
MAPHTLSFKELVWSSQFSVKESLAESYSVGNRVFLAGDACHIHSVNGGQGLNTGLADAFNLIWKLAMVEQHAAPASLLQSYEDERKPVARSVIESSGELVRSTKYSETGTHAQDYVKIVEKRAGNITGMGIGYGSGGLEGTRLYDMPLDQGATRLYARLDYTKYSLVVVGAEAPNLALPEYVQLIHIPDADAAHYLGQAVLVRPDAYIESIGALSQATAFVQALSERMRPALA